MEVRFKVPLVGSHLTRYVVTAGADGEDGRIIATWVAGLL